MKKFGPPFLRLRIKYPTLAPAPAATLASAPCGWGILYCPGAESRPWKEFLGFVFRSGSELKRK